MDAETRNGISCWFSVDSCQLTKGTIDGERFVLMENGYADQDVRFPHGAGMTMGVRGNDALITVDSY